MPPVEYVKRELQQHHPDKVQEMLNSETANHKLHADLEELTKQGYAKIDKEPNFADGRGSGVLSDGKGKPALYKFDWKEGCLSESIEITPIQKQLRNAN